MNRTSQAIEKLWRRRAMVRDGESLRLLFFRWLLHESQFQFLPVSRDSERIAGQPGDANLQSVLLARGVREIGDRPVVIWQSSGGTGASRGFCLSPLLRHRKIAVILIALHLTC